MRSLLKKGIVFQWLAEHEEEFNLVKTLLTSPMLVHYFDPKLATSLLTDASKLNGLGYVLIQHTEEGKIQLVQAGSRSLLPAERNYAPIEQECLGAVWAIDKCRYYLRGCPSFRLVTDHQPLLGIFRKELAEIDNRRLQRFREKVTDFSFDVHWVEGKSHLIADSLSRYPVDAPNSRAQEQAYFIAPILHAHDPNLNSLRESAKDCLLYTSPSPRDLSTSRMPSSA